jgi:UPF0716 protein FxsA
MFYVLAFVLLVLPIVEIAVIVEVGQATNWLFVIACTIGTAVLGAAILRRQGLGVMREYQSAAREGRAPVRAAVDGISLLLAAPLLMTPGFVTDAFGFALLVPPVRHAVARSLLKRVQRGIDEGRVTIIRR